MPFASNSQVMIVGIVLTAALWAVVGFLLAGLSGWSRLARAYRGDPGGEAVTAGASTPTRFSWVGGRLGGVTYQGCLVLGATASDLHVGIARFFRLGHPPFRVPWSEVRVESSPEGATVVLHFQRDDVASLELPRKVFERLQGPRASLS